MHRFDSPSCDEQTKPPVIIGAVGQFEETCEPVLCDTDARVPDHELQHDLSSEGWLLFYLYDNVSLFGESNCVSQKSHEYLFKTLPVATHNRRNIGVYGLS